MLVNEAPEIAESGGKGGEKGREHAPATRAAVQWAAVEGSQAQTGRAQSGSGAGVYHKNKFIGHPEQSGDGADCADKQRKRRATEGQAWMPGRPRAGIAAQKHRGAG